MKLSKQKSKLHDQAEALVSSQKELTFLDKTFIIDNWNPMATHNVGKVGGYFTPFDLAKDLSMEIAGGGVVVDACAGIGALSYANFVIDEQKTRYVCIEANPDFVRVGKRILPEAEWICGDAFSQKTWDKIGKVDEVISNPPFIRSIKSNFKPPLVSDKNSIYLMAEIAMRYSERAVFIVDQASCPFKMSGVSFLTRKDCRNYDIFNERTGISFEPTSFDTSVYLKEWVGVQVQVEVVIVTKK